METKDAITKGNKLIAEFMGVSTCTDKEHINDKCYFIENEYKKANELKYDLSWDWIMPVAEKISTEHDFVLSSTGMWACYINRKDSDINDSIADFGGFEPLIMNVWKCCVAYLEWRNKQPKYK